MIVLIQAGVGWRRRTVAGAREFALFSLMAALYLVGYALELTQQRLELLQLLARLEYLAIAYIPACWLLFCFTYCGYGHFLSRRVVTALFTLSTVTFLLYQTTDLHGLMYVSIGLDTSGPFPALSFRRGIWYWVHFMYLNAAVGAGNILFIRQFKNALPVFRRQALTMMLATFVPWLTLLLHVSGAGPRGIDLNPFGLSVTGLLFAWGVYRQQFLDIVPVARHELVERMHDPVLVFEASGRLVDHNRAARRLLDDHSAYDVGATVVEISRDNLHLGQALSHAAQGLNAFYRSEGKVFAISLTGIRTNSGHTLNLYLFHDVSGQARAEEELRTLNATLEERVGRAVEENRDKERILARQARFAALGEMIAAIAHQWRQPLTAASAIVQNMEVMHAAGRLDDAYMEKSVADAMAQFRHMSDTIDEFRGFFRPQKVPEQLNLWKTAEEAIAIIRHQLVSDNIDVDLSGGDVTPFTITGYSGELKQVVLNLLSNSRDAILERRSRQAIDHLRGLICIRFSRKGDTIRMEVHDNGTGIPPAAHDHVFDPYYTTKGDQNGTGIGLYTCRMIIESSMGGKMTLGECREGACFVIELPGGTP